LHSITLARGDEAPSVKVTSVTFEVTPLSTCAFSQTSKVVTIAVHAFLLLPRACGGCLPASGMVAGSWIKLLPRACGGMIQEFYCILLYHAAASRVWGDGTSGKVSGTSDFTASRVWGDGKRFLLAVSKILSVLLLLSDDVILQVRRIHSPRSPDLQCHQGSICDHPINRSDMNIQN
jgi:hypothetical protein